VEGGEERKDEEKWKNSYLGAGDRKACEVPACSRPRYKGKEGTETKRNSGAKAIQKELGGFS